MLFFNLIILLFVLIPHNFLVCVNKDIIISVCKIRQVGPGSRRALAAEGAAAWKE